MFIEAIDGQTIEITSPFSIEFDIQRNMYGSPNVFSFRIFNLSKRNRNRIRKDAWDIQDQRRIEFRAGYGNNLKTLAVGNIKRADSVREGTDFITTIEGFDGGLAFAEAAVDTTFQSGAQKKTILQSLIRNLNKQGIQPGAIGNFEGALVRGNSYSGNTIDIIKEITGGFFFIDNEKAYCLQDDEAILADVFVLNSSTGLLSTPKREETFLTFDILFEPSLQVGSLISLISLTEENFNGIHRVQKIHHRGIISEAVGGTAISTVGLLDGTFNPVAGL